MTEGRDIIAPPCVEMRVIELVTQQKGFDVPEFEYSIQYRSVSHGPWGVTRGSWITLPVVHVTDRKIYDRMKEGSDQ